MPDTITPTSAMTDMVQMARSGDPAAMMSAMIEQGRLSPERASLLQMMMQAQSASAPDTEAEQALEMRDDVSRLLAAADRRIGSLEALVATVAEALGACPACLGTDHDCETCDGFGVSGQSRPNRDAFSFFVLPVISRLKRPRQKTAGHPTADSETRAAFVTNRSN